MTNLGPHESYLEFVSVPRAVRGHLRRLQEINQYLEAARKSVAQLRDLSKMWNYAKLSSGQVLHFEGDLAVLGFIAGWQLPDPRDPESDFSMCCIGVPVCRVEGKTSTRKWDDPTTVQQDAVFEPYQRELLLDLQCSLGWLSGAVKEMDEFGFEAWGQAPDLSLMTESRTISPSRDEALIYEKEELWIVPRQDVRIAPAPRKSFQIRPGELALEVLHGTHVRRPRSRDRVWTYR
jgi:hypothetical protein